MSDSPEHRPTTQVAPLDDNYDNGMFVHSAVDESDMDVYEFRVFGHLCRRANGRGRSYESIFGIAAYCRISERQVQVAIRSLEAKGWIRRDTVVIDGYQRPNDITVLGHLKADKGGKVDVAKLREEARAAERGRKALGTKGGGAQPARVGVHSLHPTGAQPALKVYPAQVNPGEVDPNIPPLPPVVSGEGEETQTPPVRKLRRKKADLVSAPVLPVGDGLDGGEGKEAVPETEPPLTRRVPPARPANPMFDAVAPEVAGSTDPLAMKAAAIQVGAVVKYLTGLGIIPEEIPALSRHIHSKFQSPQPEINLGSWKKWTAGYIAIRNGTVTPATGKSSAAAAAYTERINLSLPAAADPDDSTPSNIKDGEPEW